MTADLQQTGDKEVKAFARRIHVSPRKARVVVDLLRGLSVDEALLQLAFLTKKAATPIKKLLDSAIANASHNFELPRERLFIKNFTVDGGPVFFRYTPRAQGRALPVRKRTSHLNLVLGVSAKSTPPKRRFEPPGLKKDSEAALSSAPKAPAVIETPKKPSWFKFWGNKKKKAEDSSQLPPKEDPKGKHYTGFDRRGNMGN